MDPPHAGALREDLAIQVGIEALLPRGMGGGENDHKFTRVQFIDGVVEVLVPHVDVTELRHDHLTYIGHHFTPRSFLWERPDPSRRRVPRYIL